MYRSTHVSLAVLAGIFLCVATVQAQGLTSPISSPLIGIQGGLNMARTTIDDLPSEVDNLFRTGFEVGGVLELPLQDSFSLETGVFYSMRGGRQEFAILGSPAESRLRLGYVAVPVMGKLLLGGPMSSARPFLKAGPEIAFLTSARQETELNGQTEDVDVRDDLRNIDFGIRLAGGIDIPMQRMVGTAQIGYMIGLLDINDETAIPGDTDTAAIRNQVLMFSVGVRF